MRVVAFAPALSANEEEAGGVAVKGFPMTSCYVNNFPAQITVPIVVAVTALGGTDYDPVKVIVATSPEASGSAAWSSAGTGTTTRRPRSSSGCSPSTCPCG